jgi:hypothetical protein
VSCDGDARYAVTFDDEEIIGRLEAPARHSSPGRFSKRTNDGQQSSLGIGDDEVTSAA